MQPAIADLLDRLYRSDGGKILATLIRLLGDFDQAEDALHEAFRAALEQWPASGLPENPVAWLVSAGRFRAIDRLRRSRRFETPLEDLADRSPAEEPRSEDASVFSDDRLRLIFTCCHPSIPAEGRAALTLREVCGLTTEEIASAFLVNPAALAQRIVRAKNKIREDRIPYEVPGSEDLPDRLGAVLQVIYLVFNEGYSASSGASLLRTDLSAEAIRLGRLLVELLPEPEVKGLLALMLLHESRRAARTTPQGDIVLLEEQDRALWDQALVREGVALVEEALRSRRFGPYTLQAAISALHSEAPSAQATDWAEIAALYGLLRRIDPSPIVELNQAVAFAMRDGPAAGLAIVDDILARGVLDGYHFIYSVRADLCRRLGRAKEARAAYEQAISLAQQEPERRFLAKRLAQLA